MKKIAYISSFAPVSNKDLWFIQESMNMAQEVILIMNTSNELNFTTEEKNKLLLDNIDKNSKVTIRESMSALDTENILNELECEYVLSMFNENQKVDSLGSELSILLSSQVKNIYLKSSQIPQELSIELLKLMRKNIGWHWYLKPYYPENVYNYWVDKYIKETSLKIVENTKILDFIHDISNFYNQNKRYYHNLSHIAHCLQELEWLIDNTVQNEEEMKKLCIALLAHDVIYGAELEENTDEELSAQWTYTWLINNQLLAPEQAQAVGILIEKTQYLSKNLLLENHLEQLICSIDLSVLSKSNDIYQIYMENIKKEYADIPQETYIKGRINALEKLLKMPTLYEAPEFKHYELGARKNLKNELIALKKKIFE